MAYNEVQALIGIASKGGGVDLSEFEGQKAKIEGVEIIDMLSSYDDAGAKTEDKHLVKVLKVFTEPVTTLTDKEGNKIAIRASEIFNLKEKDGKLGYSLNEKSKIFRFMAKLKVSHPADAVGKSITLRAYCNSANNVFLGFVY